MGGPPLKSGETVLVLGTGGVSTYMTFLLTMLNCFTDNMEFQIRMQLHPKHAL